ENFILTSTVMVRKACFVKAGLFDENLRVVEDRDMWLRIAANFEIACLPLLLGRKQDHQSNISKNGELTLWSRIKVWKNAQHQFPDLTSASLLNALLADAYLHLGYILLAKDRRKEACLASLRSLTYAVRHVVKGSVDRSSPPYRWFLGLALPPLTMLGWPVARSLSRLKGVLSSWIHWGMRREA